MQTTAIGFRLSPQQERIWLASEWPTGRSDVVACQVHLEGDIRAEQIESELNSALQQHEILRTDLQLLPGMNRPLQSIRETSQIAVIEHSLDPCNSDSLQTEIEQILSDAMRECANGGKSSLSVRLARIGDGASILILVVRGVCGDSATLIHLVKAIVQERAESADAVQYADLAECLQQFLSSEESHEARNYWSSRVSSKDGSRLPGQRSTRSGNPFHVDSIRFVVDSQFLKHLTKLAAKQAVTESAILLACWKLLLCRFTGEWDLTVGLQCDGRFSEELKPAFGPLSRYVPFSAESSRESPFSEFLNRVSAAIEGCELHQEYFDDPRTGREHADSPRFPFCYEFCDSRVACGNRFLSVRFEKMIFHSESFAVKLQGLRRDSDLVLNLHYDTQGFNRQRMERMADSFKALLECALREPNTACGELEVLGAEEKNAIAVAPNRTVQEYPRHSCLHQLVEDQVFKDPEAVSIVANGSQLTYGQLDERANRLANHLRNGGLPQGGIAAVCLPRSCELVTALLAILKAGAAYVPLDTAYPEERIGFILRDAKVRSVITVERFGSLFPRNIDVICMDRDQESIQMQNSASPRIKSYSEQLAYIIYTSGSTGKPKGVLIPHRTLVNYLTWCTKNYAMSAGAGSLVTSTIAFDLTVTTLWGPLVTGKTAVLLTGEPAVEKLKEELSNPGPYVLKLTPAEVGLAQHFLRPEECAGSVGAVVIGGEALYGEGLNFWREQAPETRFINEYGPTETTVGCCLYEVPPGRCAEGAVPIGRPIANTSIYVLNEEMQLQPTGVLGEIYIGGECVGNGYCDQPGATAERFLPDPFCEAPGARLYRTGDLAQWRDDGNLEYSGRNDGQVKIRGYRVEVGEVEAELRKVAGIEDAAVVVRGDSAVNRHLAGYVILRDRSLLHEQWVGEVRTQLLRVLPEYMVPSALVSLQRLPLTSHGKVDRQALSARRVKRGEADGEVPRGDLEIAIAAVWKEVLAVDAVGVEDNFFEIGGHSLALFQVHFRLQSSLNSALNVVDLMAHPTVRSLAQHLAGATEKLELLSLEERANKRNAAVQRRKEMRGSRG